MKSNYALVRKPPSALEKAEAGAKRILAGMVADTLALATRKALWRTKSPRIIVVDDEPMLLELAALVIGWWRKDAVVMPFQQGAAAWEELLRADPDLLITDMFRGGLNGYEMLPLLAKRKVNYPILVTSGCAKEEDVWQCAGPNLNVTFLQKPYEAQQLQQYLSAHLGPGDNPERQIRNDPDKPARTRPLRIVVVYSEEGPRQAIGLILRNSFNNVELLLFEDSWKAWEELSRTDPDLLITADALPGLRGSEIVGRLLDRRVTYPIIVMSAWEGSEKWVREYASRGLNVRFLAMPWTIEDVRKLLEAAGLKFPHDTLEKAQPGAKRIERTFRIGNYEWCEPDYRQILIWAAAVNLKPMDFVAGVLEPGSFLVDEDGKRLRRLPLFEEPFVAGGRLLKLGWDCRRTKCTRIEWVGGLEITHVHFIPVPTQRCLSDLGELPLPRLVWLSCGWQKLAGLNLAHVPRLQYLSCQQNCLEALNLDSVPELTELHCGENAIETLDFHSTRKLISLSCEVNCLTALDLTGLQQLEYALCDSNELTELHLLDLPALDNLICFANQITKLDLSQVPKLEHLYCQVNEIRELDLSRCPELWSLNCSNNQITELDVSRCLNLRTLDCSGNRLSTLDIRNLDKLESLNYDTRTHLLQRPDQKFGNIEPDIEIEKSEP